MNFNICIFQPPGYVHVQAFEEVIQALAYSLGELGYGVSVRANHIGGAARDVVLGAHLVPPEVVRQLPTTTVILNTEQLLTNEAGWNQSVLAWARRHIIWDYSERNIDFLRQNGALKIARLRLGYQAQLARIAPAAVQDIDVLFYGSIGPRRAHILDTLKARGVRVAAVFGVYGAQRDALIARSRLVLNLHHYESKILEVVRVFYLMNNAKAIVCELGPETEADPMYLDGLRTVPYDELVDACIELLANDSARAQLEARAFASINRCSQVDFTRTLLEQTARMTSI